jgi:hypothetical protein
LLVVREQNDSDWIAADGTPLVKIISTQIHAYMPARIIGFSPTLDGEWIRANTNLQDSEITNFSALNTEIFINDLDKQDKYSLHDLSHRLNPMGGDKQGGFDETVEFANAFLVCNGTSLKLLNYRIKYQVAAPIRMSSEIDFSKELTGVIEYLQKGKKKAIFKSGVIKSN